MAFRLYQTENQFLNICLETNTLRLWPENYLIATHKNGYWEMKPDMACPVQTVLLVTAVLMEHEIKWSKVDDGKLLSRVTGDSVKKWLNFTMSQVEMLETISLGLTL